MQHNNRAFTEEVLALGLKYTGTSKEISTLYFIAAAEATASHLDEEMAQQLILGVSSILNSVRPQKEPEWETAQSDQDRRNRQRYHCTSSSSDKGNMTVVMNQSDYTAKIESLLEHLAYEKLNRNPATRVETRTS